MAKPIKQRILKPGVVIAGKYRIEKPIARGGFSVIYRAVHVDMDRQVGLKILQLGQNVRANWLERFSREARLASQLTHQNTVTVFDYGQDDRGFLYLAMEWIEGESLYQKFEEYGALDAAEVAHIARQILASLDEAHRRGILHRDLKPSNIMITQNYEGKKTVKVLDFGIAKIFETEGSAGVKITRDGGFVGTPRYASPEQLDGVQLTPAADVYAVGLLMWEALVGDPAVPGVDFGECAKYHASPEPWRLPESTSVPAELARIVHHALEKKPEDRYESARSMHDDLVAWLGSDEAREPGFGQMGPSGFFAPHAGLGEVSSDPVDESTDDLFADLADGVPSDEVPLELEGPSEAESTAKPPPFEPPSNDARDQRHEGRSPQKQRQVTNDERPSPHPPQGEQRPNLTDQQSAGAVSGGGPSAPERRQRTQRPGKAESGDDTKIQKIVVGSAIAAIVIAGLIAVIQIMSGDDEPDAVDQGQPAASANEAAKDPGSQTPGEQAPAKDEVEDDDSVTMSVDAILMAMRQSGWSQEGEINRIDLEDANQHSTLFRAGENSIAVTIFEAKNRAIAEDIVRNTSAGQRTIRFGKNVVRLRPASGPGKKRATKKLAGVLETFKEVAAE